MLHEIAQTLVALEGLSRSGLRVEITGMAEEANEGRQIWFSAAFVLPGGEDDPLFIVDFLTGESGKGFVSTWNVRQEYEHFFTEEEMTWEQALKLLSRICKKVADPAIEMFVISTSICQPWEGGYVVQTHGPFTKEGAEEKVEKLRGRYALINLLNKQVNEDISTFEVAILPLSAALSELTSQR